MLKSVDITKATKSALKLPSPALAPFSGIKGRPDDRLDTPSERREVVTEQLASNQQNRYVIVDHAYFDTKVDLSR